MRKLLFFLLWLSATLAQAQAPHGITEMSLLPDVPQEVYTYRDTCRILEGRFNGTGPQFLVYPDGRVTSRQAVELVAQTGLDELVHQYAGSVMVVNPVGEKWDNTADYQAYQSLLKRLYAFMNLKVIGIGRGATFVNQTIGQQPAEVAGLVSIQGQPGKSTGATSPVPAYISGNRKTAAQYIRQNAARLTHKSSTLERYVNPTDTLLQVVSSTRKATLKETVAEAWEQVLSHNYRFNNYRHTWYTGTPYGQYGDYMTAPYIRPEAWGVKRVSVRKDITGTGDFIWYEFHPEATQHAPAGTVPLVLLLHGNNNDPRTQQETSGFIELCAQENFVVAELEWQNSPAFMGLDGIEQVVYYLLRTYPQLDASRVYAEGLSAGGFTATALGVRKSHLFAAVGSHSGGLMPQGYRWGYSAQGLLTEARQKQAAGIRMPYFLVTGHDDDAVVYPTAQNYEKNAIFHAWRLYQTLNAMPVTQQPDFSVDPVFGITLQDRQRTATPQGITLESGQLYSGGKPLIKLVTLMDWGHWNFPPDARVMWDYFKLWSRDPQTLESVYHGSFSTPEQVEASVRQQLETYPASTLKDLYKNFFQDAFGPGHLMSSGPQAEASARAYLEQECQEAQHDGNPGPPYELTGSHGRFYRVNLSVINSGKVPLETFLDAFLSSARQFTLPPLSQWKAEWKDTERIIRSVNPRLPDLEADSQALQALLESGQYASHHSTAYQEAYKPHYRLIESTIFRERLLPLLK